MPRERLNPPGLFKHPYFTRILKVKNPATVIFMAGHTPADENYKPVHPGDLRGQYKAILDALTYQLKAGGRDMGRRRLSAHVCPGRAGVHGNRARSQLPVAVASGSAIT